MTPPNPKMPITLPAIPPSSDPKVVKKAKKNELIMKINIF